MNDTRIDLRVSPVDVKPDGSRTAARANRLVVVLQDAEQEALLAGRILELARTRGLGILLVGLVHEPENEPELRRKLVRIAAFIGNATRRGEAALPVEIYIQRGMGWLDGIRALVRPGDQLACGADWNTGGLRRPLNDVLGGGLMQPVYVFADLRTERADRRRRLTDLLGWLISLGSVVVFCLIAARIVMETYGWLQPVLLLGGLTLEIGFIYFVNSFLGWF